MTPVVIAPLISLSLLARFLEPTVAQRPTPSRVASPRSIRAAAYLRRTIELARMSYPTTKELQEPYNNAAYGVAIRYPATWTVRNLDDEAKGKRIRPLALFLSPLESNNDASRENINLVVEELTGTIPSLEEYTDSAVARERSVFPSFTLLSSQPMEIDRLPAQQITFRTKMEGSGTEVIFEQVWCVWHRRMYVWTLAAPAESFDAMSRTFHEMLGTVNMTLPGLRGN